MEHVEDEARELYALLPGDFIAARDARVKALRSQDKALAASVKALRRPTVAAWLVNLLAHEPRALDELVSLGADLRAAQSRLDMPELKKLSTQRPSVVNRLVDHSVALAAQQDPTFADSAASREQVAATLTAALADPRAEQAVSSGRLVTALSYAGFGEVEIGDAIATPLRAVPDLPADPAPETDPTKPTEADEPEPPKAPAPVGPSPAQIKAAEKRVADAERKVEVAEAALAQARSRRAAARRDLDEAIAALEDLQDLT